MPFKFTLNYMRNIRVKIVIFGELTDLKVMSSRKALLICQQVEGLLVTIKQM